MQVTQTVVREAQGDNPQLVRVDELPVDQLHQPSDFVDKQTGERLTTLQAHQAYEQAAHGGDIIVNRNGLMSDEGNRHNSRVTRTGEGVAKVALVARRPGPDQTTY